MLKKFPKIILYLFISIFILQILSLTFLLLTPKPSQAADIKFIPQVGIPGEKTGDDTKDFSGKSVVNFSDDKTIRPIGEYIRWFYKYAIGAVGILATIVMMFGGVLWITAMGSPERITDAKAWITASLTGLFLALTSYLMLATINPALVNLNTPGVANVKDSATKSGGFICDNKSENECKAYSGCSWNNNTCITQVVTQCGLTSSDITTNSSGVTCCTSYAGCDYNTKDADVNHKYFYARIGGGSLCSDVCGTPAPTRVDERCCKINIGY
ncbi:MAG: hypothetical protein US81_C0037G0003 [Parcubacteria group bacterium GW2011_GWE2_38_18]|nr:MAG: hypothetical protein US81_C0037G0003 [Parcubacteria group bacterium GW2011_GWE2_38_18]